MSTSFEDHGFSIESVEDRLSSVESAVEENTELREEVNELREELAKRPTREEHEELRKEYEELREQVDEQPDVEIRSDDPESREIADVWVDGLPLGPAVENAKQRSQQNSKLLMGSANDELLAELTDEHPAIIDCLGDGTDAGPVGLPEEVQQQMRPIHQMAEEVKNGRLERLANQHSARRGARLFARIHRRASGQDNDDLSRLVKKTPKQYVLRAPDAAEILDADGDPDKPDGVDSETAKRAMSECARLSGTDELAPLVELQTDEHVNRLVVDREKFTEAMAVLQDVADAARDDPDGRDDPDDAAAVEAELDELADAGGDGPV